MKAIRRTTLLALAAANGLVEQGDPTRYYANTGQLHMRDWQKCRVDWDFRVPRLTRFLRIGPSLARSRFHLLRHLLALVDFHSVDLKVRTDYRISLDWSIDLRGQ